MKNKQVCFCFRFYYILVVNVYSIQSKSLNYAKVLTVIPISNGMLDLNLL